MLLDLPIELFIALLAFLKNPADWAALRRTCRGLRYAMSGRIEEEKFYAMGGLAGVRESCPDEFFVGAMQRTFRPRTLTVWEDLQSWSEVFVKAARLGASMIFLDALCDRSKHRAAYESFPTVSGHASYSELAYSLLKARRFDAFECYSKATHFMKYLVRYKVLLWATMNRELDLCYFLFEHISGGLPKSLESIVFYCLDRAPRLTAKTALENVCDWMVRCAIRNYPRHGAVMRALWRSVRRTDHYLLLLNKNPHRLVPGDVSRALSSTLTPDEVFQAILKSKCKLTVDTCIAMCVWGAGMSEAAVELVNSNYVRFLPRFIDLCSKTPGLLHRMLSSAQTGKRLYRFLTRDGREEKQKIYYQLAAAGAILVPRRSVALDSARRPSIDVSPCFVWYLKYPLGRPCAHTFFLDPNQQWPADLPHLVYPRVPYFIWRRWMLSVYGWRPPATSSE